MSQGRSIKISVRFNNEEFSHIEKKAAEKGCTTSEWIRRRVLSGQNGIGNVLSEKDILMKIFKRVTEAECLILQHYEDKGDAEFVQRAKKKASNSLSA